MLSLLLLAMQPAIDAGPAQVSCGGGSVTLWAIPVNEPNRFLIQWDDNPEPGVFHVVQPLVTTDYRVTMIDLDTSMVFEDWTRVVVHPGDPDLNGDTFLNTDDWTDWYALWNGELIDPDADPNGNGVVDIRDWFFFCNYDVAPPNTPPSLSVPDALTVMNESVFIDYQIDDAETIPTIQIDTAPGNGDVVPITGRLFYTPQDGFVGFDSFQVSAFDGFVQTPPISVNVEVSPLETWGDLFSDIFMPRCGACHVDAVSGGLSMSTYTLARMGGISGAGFIANFPEQSEIYRRVIDGSMPPVGLIQLTPEEIERIRRWILFGALP